MANIAKLYQGYAQAHLQQPTADDLALPYGHATTGLASQAGFAQNDPRLETDQAAPSKEEQLGEAATFWTTQPGFEDANSLLDHEKPLDEDEIYKNNLFGQQAQLFMLYRQGYYKDGQLDLTSISLEDQILLTTPYEQLTDDEKKKLTANAINEACWIGNNTGSMVKAFAQLNGNDVPDELKRASLFMMDVSENLSVKANWWNKTKRFVVQGVLTDPTTIGSVALGAVTFGAGTVASQGAIQASRFAGTQLLRKGLQKAATMTITKNLRNATITGMVQAGADGLIHNAAEQGIKTQEITVNGHTMQRQQEFSYTSMAISGGVGAAFGGVMVPAGHYGAKYLGKAWSKLNKEGRISSIFSRKATNTNEPHVDAEAKVDAETPKADADTDAPKADAEAPKAETTETKAKADEETTSASDTEADLKNKIAGNNAGSALPKKIQQELQAIEDILSDPKHTDEVTKLAKDPSYLEAFIKNTYGKDFGTLSQEAQKRLRDPKRFIAFAQEQTFLREVDEAIATENFNFDFDAVRKQYAHLSPAEESIANKQASFKQFNKDRHHIVSAIEKQYEKIRTTPEESLTAELKAFKKAYEKNVGKDKEINIDQDGKVSIDQEAYNKISKAFYKVIAKENGLKLPKFETGISTHNSMVYARTMNAQKYSMWDWLRIDPRIFPTDANANIHNALDAVNETLHKNGISEKFLEMQAKITDINESKTLSEAAKSEKVAQLVSDFQTPEIKKALAQAEQDIAIISHTVDQTYTVKPGSGLRKGINQKQKTALLDNINTSKK